MALPRAIRDAIAGFSGLPGIGARSAERITLGLVAGPPGRVDDLAAALRRLHEEIGRCPTCHYFTDRDVCTICSDRDRDQATICVVEDVRDVVAFEKAGGFSGVYHVLGGALHPIRGVGPDQLHITDLVGRAADPAVREVILATSPSTDGDATRNYLRGVLEREGLLVTQIGRGVSTGSSLEFTDAGTLRMALEGRR